MLRALVTLFLLIPGLLSAEVLFSTNEAPIQVEGVVTFHRKPDPYYFMEASDGRAWRVEGVEKKVRVQAGDRVTVSGWTVKNCATPRIGKANTEVVGKGMVPAPREMTVEEMYALDPDGETGRRDWYGRLVVVSGTVLDVNRRETFAQVLIGTKKRFVHIPLPLRWEDPLPEGLTLGAVVRAKGVGVYTALPDTHRGPVTELVNFNVLVEKTEDLHVVSVAPFWTVSRVLIVFGIFAVLTGLVIAFLQRQRVRERVAADAARRERLRLTGELHDNFQQLLAGSMFRLGAAMGKVGKDDAAAMKQLELLRNSLNHTQSSLRAALWGLTEEAEGPEALTELFKYATSRMPQWEGKVKFTIRGRERAVARQCSGSLLLILQEAIGNALRHGNATEIDVVVHFGEKKLVVGIRDNGLGFDAKAEAPTGHLGLASMRQHAEGLGGTLVVRSAPGHGAAIVVRIPL